MNIIHSELCSYFVLIDRKGGFLHYLFLTIQGQVPKGGAYGCKQNRQTTGYAGVLDPAGGSGSFAVFGDPHRLFLRSAGAARIFPAVCNYANSYP
jgi:hypothetical protein